MLLRNRPLVAAIALGLIVLIVQFGRFAWNNRQQILAEVYDTQLERHELEVNLAEARVAQLRVELVRRREAKPYVVEVQLGRIVLESQGLLGR